MAESIFWPVSARSLRPIWASRPCTTSLRFLSRNFFNISWRFCTAGEILAGLTASVTAAADGLAFLAAFFLTGFLAAFLTVFFAAGFRALAAVFSFFPEAFFLTVFFTFVPFRKAISYTSLLELVGRLETHYSYLA